MYICIYSNIIYCTLIYWSNTWHLSLRNIILNIYPLFIIVSSFLDWISLASSSFSSSSCRTEFIFKSRCCCPHCLELDQWRWLVGNGLPMGSLEKKKDAVLTTFWKLCTIISSSNFSLGVAQTTLKFAQNLAGVGNLKLRLASCSTASIPSLDLLKMGSSERYN